MRKSSPSRARARPCSRWRSPALPSPSPRATRARLTLSSRSAAFTEKLRTLESNGRPLWNGADPFRIRPASAAEIRAFVQYAETLGFEDEEEGDIVLYLRPIETPDDFDETQDG